MKIRKATLEDFEEIVDMFYEFTKEIYTDRKIGSKFFFHQAVSKWFTENKDVIVTFNDDSITGFSLAYLDYNNGLTEPIYFGEIAYVKPEYRKTRAAYMLYKNGDDYAKEKGLTAVTNALATTGVSKMVQKHFDCREMFINLERKKNEL